MRHDKQKKSSKSQNPEQITQFQSRWNNSSAFSTATKRELADLIEELTLGNALALPIAIDFVMTDTLGIWHGRARAKICRRLKHIALDEKTKDHLAEIIAQRIESGTFSQQFKDQLTMAIRFRPERLRASATLLLNSQKTYLQRYSAWVLNKINSRCSNARNG